MDITGIGPISEGSYAGDAQIAAIQERLALLAAHKVMKIQKDIGHQIIALLDPNTGTQFDKRA